MNFILPIYRLIDGVNYRFAIVFVDRYNKHWGLWSLNRTIILLTLNLIEIIIIFSILYLNSHSIGFKDQVILFPLDSLYFSFVTFTTGGYGDWTPINDTSKFLVILELLTAFIFISFVITIFMTGINFIKEAREIYNGDPIYDSNNNENKTKRK